MPEFKIRGFDANGRRFIFRNIHSGETLTRQTMENYIKLGRKTANQMKLKDFIIQVYVLGDGLSRILHTQVKRNGSRRYKVIENKSITPVLIVGGAL